MGRGHLGSPLELLKPQSELVAIRTIFFASRRFDQSTGDPFEAQFEKWAIMYFEQPIGNMNAEIGIDADQVSIRIPKPAVIRRVQVDAQKGVFHHIIAGVDLLVGLALIVIPDPPASSGEHGSDGQQPGHLPGLKMPRCGLIS